MSNIIVNQETGEVLDTQGKTIIFKHDKRYLEKAFNENPLALNEQELMFMSEDRSLRILFNEFLIFNTENSILDLDISDEAIAAHLRLCKLATRKHRLSSNGITLMGYLKCKKTRFFELKKELLDLDVMRIGKFDDKKYIVLNPLFMSKGYNIDILMWRTYNEIIQANVDPYKYEILRRMFEANEDFLS